MRKLKNHIPILLLISGIIFGCNNDNSKNEVENQTPEVNSKYLLNLNNACGFYTQIKEKKIYTFNSDIEADLAVSKIMKLTGLPANFTIKAANVDNAAATIICLDSSTCVRYILYNQEFMQLVKDNTKTHFAEMSILAHEIGHHLSGHTLSSTGNSHDQELEADKFSGFILFKMGASLDEAEAAVNKLCSESGSLTHPPKSARLAAIANGWYEAKKSGGNASYTIQRLNSSTNVLITPILKKEGVKTEINSKEDFNNLISEGKYKGLQLKGYEAIADFNKAIDLFPKNAEGYYWRGWAKFLSPVDDFNGALADFNRAIKINPSYGEAYFYRGLTKHQLNDKDGMCEDLKKACELGENQACNSPFYSRCN